MKKLILVLASAIITLCPSLSFADAVPGYAWLYDQCQYGPADWSHVTRIENGISLKKAVKIANADDSITYFVYVKGFQLVLQAADGTNRVFNQGDTIFFADQNNDSFWMGSAQDLADTYVKQ